MAPTYNARPARCRVVGKFDRSVPQEATVTIERNAGLFTVRPLRARGDRVYTLPLATVASMVAQRVIQARLVEKRRLRADARKQRRARK